ncbi:hypothetical protein GCM10023196_036520 [Actinoallomurus vinaceus]|uniref:Uncharacterized protein n=1 Tax=Actinoallomurus vinaceus TaxID=1080074 RepID=A0ABP8UBW5_9ACTN
MSKPNHQDRMAELVRMVTAVVDDHFQERADRVLNAYRPQIVADVGEDITRQVTEDPGFNAFLLAAYDEAELEPEVATHEAAAWLRDHPDATPEQAFAAVREACSGCE